MTRAIVVLIAAGLGAGCAGRPARPPPPAAPAPAPPVDADSAAASAIRERLTSSGDTALGPFYEARAWRPAWTAAAAAELVATVRAADREGLRPSDYAADSIQARLERTAGPADLAALDILLSRTFLRYARHLASGRFFPPAVDTMWSAPPGVDLHAGLAAVTDAGTVGEALRRLAPPHEGYARLRAALERFRGDTARLRRIEANLERWRWVPRDLGPAYVMVNVPGFSLELVEAGRAVHAARVVAGRPEWPTPITTAALTHVVFHPSWYVPRAIALAEIVPAAARDSAYFTRTGIRVYPSRGGAALDPTAIDWRGVTESSYVYRLVQGPGPTNPLGAVRFQLVSPFGVMLHDTPQRELFTGEARAMSHGCVRVAEAGTLANLLLGAVSGWTRDSTAAALALGRERPVALPRAIPVVLAYWTAWVDDDGVTQLRDDVYGWDARVTGALAGPPAPASSSARTSASLVCEKSP